MYSQEKVKEVLDFMQEKYGEGILDKVEFSFRD